MNLKKYSFILIAIIVWVVVYLNLDNLASWLVFDIFNMDEEAHLAMSLHFFIFEVPKVLLLLILIIFVVGVVRSYFSPEKTRKALEGKSLLKGNIMAAILGVFTPFCSCSAIPLFLGFVEAGIPIGVTFSFLIAAPMVNEVAVILLAGLFGWRVTLIYVSTGLLVAIVAGYVLEKLNMKRFVADWVYQVKANQESIDSEPLLFGERIDAGLDTVKEIVGKIWIYILAGIAIGAAAHGYVPDNYMARLLGEQNWYSIPLAIAIGIPLYSNAAGIIPIVAVLIEKGVSLGTALVFMMSVIGLSLPEIIILKKVLKWQLVVSFIGVVAIGILLVGYIINYIL